VEAKIWPLWAVGILNPVSGNDDHPWNMTNENTVGTLNKRVHSICQCLGGHHEGGAEEGICALRALRPVAEKAEGPTSSDWHTL